jgi:hypothetical protein
MYKKKSKIQNTVIFKDFSKTKGFNSGEKLFNNIETWNLQQSYIPRFNPIAAKMAIESMENWKILKIHWRWRGVTLAQMN